MTDNKKLNSFENVNLEPVSPETDDPSTPERVELSEAELSDKIVGAVESKGSEVLLGIKAAESEPGASDNLDELKKLEGEAEEVVAGVKKELSEKKTVKIELADGSSKEILVSGKPFPMDEKGEIDPEGEIGWEQLVGVRETAFYPNTDEAGRMYIPTPYEATKENPDPTKREYRLTTHLTLNHQVEEHGQRESLKEGYVIITPMEGLVKSNGKPANMYSVDTYYRKDRLYLPEGTVVLKIGDAQTEDVIRKMGYTVMEADEHRITTKGAEEVLDKFVDQPENSDIEVQTHTRSIDGSMEGKIQGLMTGNTNGPQLEAVLMQYDRKGLEYYQPYILEGIKKLEESTDDDEVKKIISQFKQEHSIQ